MVKETPGAPWGNTLGRDHAMRRERLAIHMLIEAAEDCGQMLFARVGMLRAMGRDAEPRLGTGRRQARRSRRGRQKLARYR
jgi:hypothetical protein